MPGSMIHLLLAKKIAPQENILFYVASIAPDAVPDWHIKDITHFRNLDDRMVALNELAAKTSKTDSYGEGVLLHLYLDWRWDTGPRDKYIASVGDDWFHKYRNEVSLSSSYAFHHTPWALKLWDEIEQVDMNDYGETPCATKQEVRAFVLKSIGWHKNNVLESSSVFTPNFIDEFLSEIADEYIKWREH